MLILEPVVTPRFVGRPIKMLPPMPKVLSLVELEANVVNPRVIAALREVSRRLSAAKVRHAVLGGIAVGVHGWPRATRDVDLLVAPEAWRVERDGTYTPLVELPEQIDGIEIDYLPISVAGDFLLEAFDRAHLDEGIPIAPVEVVILTKLMRLVMRDQADIVELVKAGLFSNATVEAHLETHAPMLTSRFRQLVEQAEREERAEREG